MEAPPAPAPRGPMLPNLSLTVLLAMAAIGAILLAAIFGYILFLASGLRIDERLWWTGLASMIFALGFYFLFAVTHDRKVARPLAGGFFVISAGSFDLLIELVCTDNNDLLKVVERIRAVDGVRSTESFIYISRHKLNYAYAPEPDKTAVP